MVTIGATPAGGVTGGGASKDNQPFLNPLFRMLRTGAPPYQVRGSLWRDLPRTVEIGTTPIIAFADEGTRGRPEGTPDMVIEEPGCEWLAADAATKRNRRAAVVLAWEAGTGAKASIPASLPVANLGWAGEWLKPPDCKSGAGRLRRFKFCPSTIQNGSAAPSSL